MTSCQLVPACVLACMRLQVKRAAPPQGKLKGPPAKKMLTFRCVFAHAVIFQLTFGETSTRADPNHNAESGAAAVCYQQNHGSRGTVHSLFLPHTLTPYCSGAPSYISRCCDLRALDCAGCRQQLCPSRLLSSRAEGVGTGVGLWRGW